MFTAYQVSKYLKAMGFNVTNVNERTPEADGEVLLGDGRIHVQVGNDYMIAVEQRGPEVFFFGPNRISLMEIKADLEELTGGTSGKE